MKTFKSYLDEATGGDCFQVAAKNMIDLTDKEDDAGYKLVHAYVRGQGELKERRFPHAFNKLGNTIYDDSNGNHIIMTAKKYFELGNINPKESGAYAEYSKNKSMMKLLKNNHYGPWDLNSKLDENIPDNNRGIGKKKMRIGRKEIEKIKNENF
jgi:hypothetical protein|tara:strand:- start:170 stop:631 length:462 start_codon:yes stop_codon:yes gene_type:complete